MVEHVRLVDDQDRGPPALGCFPGQDAPGLDGEGGGAVDGFAARGPVTTCGKPVHGTAALAVQAWSVLAGEAAKQGGPRSWSSTRRGILDHLQLSLDQDDDES